MNLASSRRQQFTTENAKTHVTFVINPEISLRMEYIQEKVLVYIHMMNLASSRHLPSNFKNVN